MNYRKNEVLDKSSDYSVDLDRSVVSVRNIFSSSDRRNKPPRA